jgi:hypothetical protein
MRHQMTYDGLPIDKLLQRGLGHTNATEIHNLWSASNDAPQ